MPLLLKTRPDKTYSNLFHLLYIGNCAKLWWSRSPQTGKRGLLVDRDVLKLDCGDDCTIYIFSITDLYASNGWILRYIHYTSKKLLKENYNGWIHSDYTETHKSTGRNKSTNFLFWKLVTKRNEKKRITHFSCLSCANYQIALLDREETYYTHKNSSWCDRMIELENHHFTILMK